MGVGMGTTNLFGHPAFKDGAFTSNDRRVRRAAIGKSMRGIDLAAELNAEIFVFWGGREGTEVGAAKDPRDALERYREAVNVLVDYSREQRLRPALRHRAEAQRAARRHLPADRRPRPALHLDARPARARGPEPGGRPRDDGGAVVPPRESGRRCGRASSSTSTSTRSGSGATTRTSASARRTSRRRSCSSGCSSARATPGRCTSTRTLTATRTPRACGTSRPAACAPTGARRAGARLRRAARGQGGARRRARPTSRSRQSTATSPDTLKAEADALDELATRGYYNERLDQLVVEVLMGLHT